MTVTVGAYEAKTTLSRLLTLVEQGETVIITKHGRPLARLSPVREPESPLEEVLGELAQISRRAAAGPDSVSDLIRMGRRR